MPRSRPSPDGADQRAVAAARAREIGLLLRRLQTEGDRLSSAVAGRERVGHSDLAALRHIMDADLADAPLTATGLQELLGLSSGATTAVIDRLETAGHARRERGHRDRRRVTLRFAPAAQEVGLAYFAPLGRRVGEVLAGYDEAEVEVIDRFLTQLVAVYAEHAAAVRRGPDVVGPD